MNALKLVSINVTKKGNSTIILSDNSQVTFFGQTIRVFGAPRSKSLSCWFTLEGDHTIAANAAMLAGTLYHVDPRDISVADEATGHRGGFIHPDDIKMS
tara:strand:+ start:145 stop:441 length:297 start_codon:yes stop_codon:yes gene_type:complete